MSGGPRGKCADNSSLEETAMETQVSGIKTKFQKLLNRQVGSRWQGVIRGQPVAGKNSKSQLHWDLCK